MCYEEASGNVIEPSGLDRSLKAWIMKASTRALSVLKRNILFITLTKEIIW